MPVEIYQRKVAQELLEWVDGSNEALLQPTFIEKAVNNSRKTIFVHILIKTPLPF